MSDPVENLSNDELFEIVWAIREILWPNGDREHQWSPDTMQDVANVFIGRDLYPPR